MTVVDTALRQALRTLKLSGMLETLDARLTQARAGELGHLDFLQVLCHDEISRRDTQAITRRLRRPGSTKPPPWRSSISTPAPSSRPRRSVTWPRCAGCTPASP